MKTILKTLSIKAIDRTDEYFCIGSFPCDEIVQRDLDQWGMLEPLIVQQRGELYRILDGFDRFDCAVRKGMTELPCAVAELDDISCYRFALDKAIQRQSYDIFDVSTSLRVLAEDCSISRNKIIEKYLPLFGFGAHEKILNKLLLLNELEDEQISLLRQNSVDADKILLLSEVDPSIRPAVLTLIVQLRPGINKCRQILELLDEISRREQITIADVLVDDSIQKILDDETCNAGQKLNRFRDALYERRNPTVVRTMELVDKKIRQLKLDKRVKLFVPQYLEGKQLRLEATFEDAAGLKEIARNLLETAGHTTFGELIDIVKEP